MRCVCAVGGVGVGAGTIGVASIVGGVGGGGGVGGVGSGAGAIGVASIVGGVGVVLLVLPTLSVLAVCVRRGRGIAHRIKH